MALPIWQELMVGVELAFLQLSPIWWGYGVPKGDGAAVVVLPGFLGTDGYLDQLRNWLDRVGYCAYCSGIEFNADCPNLLIRTSVTETVNRAWAATGRKVHLIGHSLGGMLALSTAAQMPDRVASVITLGSPINGVCVHPKVLQAVESVRRQIIERHGARVLPRCYTAQCTCDFLESLLQDIPGSVRQTAIYTRCDGIVDWHCCLTGDADVDIEVSASHLGMVFNPLVYSHIGHRLAAA